MKPHSTYFKNLDSLRAFAALAVILAHAALWIPAPVADWVPVVKDILSFDNMGGTYGVDFFFILSGFLITYRLLQEKQATQSIHLWHFYGRRILRIWPLYFISLLTGFVVYPLWLLSLGQPHVENASPALYATFLANFDHLWNGEPATGILGVQWSVAVEEQFYLCWPLLFLGRIRPVFMLVLMGALVIGSECFFLANVPGPLSYYHSLSCLRFLATGGMIGLFSFYYPDQIQLLFSKIPKWASALIAIAGIAMLGFASGLSKAFPPAKYVIHGLPFALFSFIILEQCFSPHAWIEFGRSKVVRYLGKISYGLYLLHMVAVYIVLETPFLNQPDLFLLNILLVILLTVGLSALSFRYVEKPFLRWKLRFSKMD